MGNKRGVVAASGNLEQLRFTGPCGNAGERDRLLRRLWWQGHRSKGIERGRRVVFPIAEVDVGTILAPVKFYRVGAGTNRHRKCGKGVEPTPGDGDAIQRGDRIDTLENNLFDLGGSQAGVLRQDQGRHARHVRRCHRGPIEAVVTAAWNRTVNGRSRCSEINRRGSVVREIGKRVVVVR